MSVDEEEFNLETENINLRRLLEQAGIDAAQHEATERLQRLLMEELHHRIRNTLATVHAIASQSLQSAQTMDLAREAIQHRLFALGRVHDLLLQTGGVSAKLSAVISAAIEPFHGEGSAQFVVQISDIDVRADAVLPLAMTLNELCTNALKYGALSTPNGKITLTTRVDTDVGLFGLNWVEEGGPLVRPPTRRGFGLRLIEMSLSRRLQGRSQIDFAPAGLTCELDVPLAAIKL